jgi:hypothetical protein
MSATALPHPVALLRTTANELEYLLAQHPTDLLALQAGLQTTIWHLRQRARNLEKSDPFQES